MPTYDYECPNCWLIREEHHKASEDRTFNCYNCGKKLNKVFLTAPVMRMSNYDKDGKWCGNSSDCIKKFPKKK